MIRWINKRMVKWLCISLFTVHYSLFTGMMLTSCDNYIDITPKGAVTVDSAYQYYELVVNPMRCYYPSSFALLSDDLWARESNILGYETQTMDGINFTFNEAADRTILPDNNLYENMYSNILRSNLIIDNIDASSGTPAIKSLAKAEARTFRAFDHFLAVNTFAKAYDPATAATDGGVCVMDHYDLEATPAKATVAHEHQHCAVAGRTHADATGRRAGRVFQRPSHTVQRRRCP